MAHWAYDAIFYHIYPLGLCGAPGRNDFCSPATPRLAQLYGWLDHIEGLGANALYLGPVFESTAHGYDTVDYYHVDRRLGNNDTLARLSAALHARGMRLVLDGVFNHVGRNFWAFYDVLTRGEGSAYRDWFYGLRFGPRSPYNDPFTYEGWNGHYDLVKLDLHNPAVKDHIFQAVAAWVREFDIDGLRLDAADHLDLDFLHELAAFCRSLRPDFWLMGEVVHGDYRRWVNPKTLDSVTNYECYKGLYSSHVDENYFEIAYALNRQFGEGGLYRDLPLYAFADNHDVNRVASNLTDPAHLYPLYALLFTMPGVPSIYYGSEWGIAGRKLNGNDGPLRPHLEPGAAARTAPHPGLAPAIARLAQIRRRSDALRHGAYRQLYVAHRQLAFARDTPGESVIVAINAAGEPAAFDLPVPGGCELVDWLNEGERCAVRGGRVRVEVPPAWARVMVARC
ncbi:MAG: alpha-glucosidase C-terminal domain-containing protein [Anaerolineae bacterium]|nr:alpha-glucosidase C-terminal domain-containing protein [Anaerolineae bacterium]